MWEAIKITLAVIMGLIDILIVLSILCWVIGGPIVFIIMWIIEICKRA